MNMNAVAGYLKGLREGQGLSQIQVAAEVGRRLSRAVQPTTIWRIESGRNTPGSDMLIAILDYLGGSVKDLGRLATDPAASGADGYQTALDYLKAAATHATPEQRQAVAARLRAMADDLDNP
jgi:transcriptional regulator with XRE-family HTH domain